MLASSPHQRLIGIFVCLLLLVVFYYNQIVAPLSHYPANDFKHLYLASILLADDISPYPAENLFQAGMEVGHSDLKQLNPYVYPPFTGYFFWWLGLMDYPTAKLLWFWLGHLLLLISGVLLYRLLPELEGLSRLVLLLGSVALFFPLMRSSTAGQLNLWLLFLFCLAIWLWSVGSKKSAAGVVALAALIKVVPAYLLLWMAWKREWGALFIAVVVMLGLVFVPAVQHGLQPWFEYLQLLPQMGYGSSTWSEVGANFYVDPGNIAFPALVYRTMVDNPVTQSWVDWPRLAKSLCLIWAVGVVLICLWACRVWRKDEDPAMEMGCWITGMLLIPSLFWDHYLVLMLPAWVLLVARLPGLARNELWFAVIAGCWVWLCWRFYWFDPNLLSGWRLLWLNAPLPSVVVLFLVSANVAKTGKPTALRTFQT